MTKVTGLLWQARDRGIELLSRATTYHSPWGDSKPHAQARYAYAMEAYGSSRFRLSSGLQQKENFESM